MIEELIAIGVCLFGFIFVVVFASTVIFFTFKWLDKLNEWF